MSIESNQKRRQEISIIPLINVVFLLLVFFLVAGTAIDADEGVVALPESVVRAEGVQEAEITISLTSTGKWLLDGQPTTREGLSLTLSRVLTRQVKLPVMLRADASVSARELIVLLKHVREAGAEEIFIATRDLSEG